MMQKWPMLTGIILSVLGLAIVIITSLMPSFNDWSWSLNPELAAQFGSFTGGLVGAIFSVVGFLFILQSILDQRLVTIAQQFENRLFELIKYHQNNVASMLHRPSSSKKDIILTGRNVFIELNKQLIELLNLIRKKLTRLSELEAINIAYIIFFYGVSRKSIDTTREVLDIYLEAEEIESLIEKIRKVKTKYDDKIVFYGGHQSKLGHYFRQVFHIIKYIDAQKTLSDKEKYEYGRLFRAQLSNYEQAVCFFNALSLYGSPWLEAGYIKTYKLIKNIPPKLLYPVDPKTYFPEIDFEYEEYKEYNF